MGPGALRFLERVADAYRASPLEVLAIVLALLLLLGGLVVYAAVWGRRERRHGAQLSRELYDQKSRELKLTSEHHQLLGALARYLRDPTRIHQLLTDEIAFNAAAAHLREHGGASAQEISALRFALGYQAVRSDRAPRSSTQIPEDATVLVARNRYRKPVKAKVLAPTADRFRITLLDEGARAPVGALVDIYFQNRAGVFMFSTSVMEERGPNVGLLHSEEIKQYQKRRYFRRRVDMPVHVYPFDSDRPLLSRFRDIGGGGASLLNTSNHFKVGDELELRFTPDDEQIKLTGTVMRLSENGSVMHVNYEHIRDGLRDRIYAAIFKPPKDEQEAMEQGGRPGSRPRKGERPAGQRPSSGQRPPGQRDSGQRPAGERPEGNPPAGDQGTKTTS